MRSFASRALQPRIFHTMGFAEIWLEEQEQAVLVSEVRATCWYNSVLLETEWC